MEAVLYEKRFDTGSVTEVSEDYTLPDYRPEIRRVVGVRGTAAVDGKYLSGEELEADGSVTWNVAYLDPEGRLCEVSETTSFGARLPARSDPSPGTSASGAGEGDRFGTGDLILTADAENAGCRVTGPRRVTLSARVRLGLLSQKPADMSLNTEELPPECAASVRRKTKRVGTARMSEVRGSFEVSGEIREKEGRIAGAQGTVCVTETKIEGDRLSFCGDAMVTVLLAREDPQTGREEYLITRGRARTEESIAVPAENTALRRAAVFPKVILTELETDPQSGVIRWRMEYDADAALIRQGESEVTEDAYSPDIATKSEERSCLSLSATAVRNGRLTLTGRFRTGRGAEFLGGWGTADPGKCAVQGGKAQTAGSVKLTLLTRTGDEIGADEVTLPLRYEWEALPGADDADEDLLSGRLEAGVAEISARPAETESGIEWTVTAELWIAAAVLRAEPVRGTVRLIPAQEEEPPRKNVIRVYVPEPDETPWDVEKRFRLPGPAEMTDGVYVI